MCIFAFQRDPKWFMSSRLKQTCGKSFSEYTDRAMKDLAASSRSAGKFNKKSSKLTNFYLVSIWYSEKRGTEDTKDCLWSEVKDCQSSRPSFGCSVILFGSLSLLFDLRSKKFEHLTWRNRVTKLLKNGRISTKIRRSNQKPLPWIT